MAQKQYKWVCFSKKQPMRNHEIISIFYSKQCTYNYIKEPRQMSESSKKRMNYDFTSIKGKNVQQNGIKKVKFIPEDKELSYPKTIKYFENISNNSNDRVHPTQKPVALMEYLIKTYTNENELVLDFTMGSGTTGVACKNLNRRFIGIEMDDKYFEIAKQRIENTIVEKSLFK